MSDEVERLHATVVVVGGRGILLRGASGSGKSDLALRLIAAGSLSTAADRPLLVADDHVILTRTARGVAASAPPMLRGLLEVRGVGITTLDVAENAMIALVVDLVRDEPVERLPDPWPMCEILSFLFPTIRLRAFEASAPLKIRTAITMSSLPPVRPKQ